jgi:hypothetical protein
VSEHDARGPKSQLNEAGPVIRLADRPVNIQTTSQPAPATPCWFGEVVVIVEYLRKHGLLTRISEGVRFARRRFGHYEMIDFLAVLAGLCHQRRTHPGGILPKPPALCRSFHGLV